MQDFLFADSPNSKHRTDRVSLPPKSRSCGNRFAAAACSARAPLGSFTKSFLTVCGPRWLNIFCFLGCFVASIGCMLRRSPVRVPPCFRTSRGTGPLLGANEIFIASFEELGKRGDVCFPVGQLARRSVHSIYVVLHILFGLFQ